MSFILIKTISQFILLLYPPGHLAFEPGVLALVLNFSHILCCTQYTVLQYFSYLLEFKFRIMYGLILNDLCNLSTMVC